jgi:spermidine/putrescine transport system permease protein
MVILRTEGIVNTVLQALHLADEPVRLLYTPLAVLSASCTANSPS